MKPALLQFLRLARHRPGKAAVIAFWYATRRRVRARGQLADALAQLPFSLEYWTECGAREDYDRLRALPRNAQSQCALTVHVHVERHGIDTVSAAVASVLGQSWPHWQLIITATDDASAPDLARLLQDARVRLLSPPFQSYGRAFAATLAEAATRYIVPLQPGCSLPSHALLAYAGHIALLTEVDDPILYGDQGVAGGGDDGSGTWFKPEWDRDLALAQDFVSAACALPVVTARQVVNAIAEDCSARTAVDGLLLHSIGVGARFEHLHRLTALAPAEHWCHPCTDRIATLNSLPLPDKGVVAVAGPFGTAKIRWPLPAPEPLVSIVIPTRDRVELLQTCVDGVLAHTRYTNFEIIIADNGSEESATLAYMAAIAKDPRVRVVAWPYAYNYSAINNFAVTHARGEYLCLLNNDIEIIDGEWLGELMRHACREGIGAVGARLLYPDRSIQHAGVVVGMGNAAGHAHRALPEGDPGYFAHALVAREATAVTAACLVVSRKAYDAVRGLDETNLKIAYNDVDFCLKLKAAGLRNIYAPDAVLIHHESKSRGLDMAPEHLARYLEELAVLQARWDTKTFQDPTHHPALDRSSEVYRTP
jgi:GT2 family glycosyltransferase